MFNYIKYYLNMTRILDNFAISEETVAIQGGKQLKKVQGIASDEQSGAGKKGWSLCPYN